MYFHANNDKLSALVSYPVLAMGLANLLWMPLALCFGKRPVVLFTMVMFLCGLIWSCVAQTYDSLLAARVFASFGEIPPNTSHVFPSIPQALILTLSLKATAVLSL